MHFRKVRGKRAQTILNTEIEYENGLHFPAYYGIIVTLMTRTLFL